MNKNFNDNTILINSLKKGDELAYAYLLKEYQKRLYAYAFSLINDHAMTQDIVQNVFYNIWKFKSKLDNKYKIKNILFKSVYNEFINTYQKNKATILLQQKYHAYYLREIVESLDKKYIEERIILVNSEIEKLPKTCKKVFLLSKKEGLTNIEIAEFLNISVKGVEAQITKSFKILRKNLKDKL